MNDDANVNVKIHVNDDSKAAVEEAKNGFAGLWKQVGGGVVAAQLVNDAWEGLKTGIKAVTDNYKEHQQAEAQLQAVLKSTGGAAGVTADQVNNLADSIMKTTPIDGEAALAAENMLLTFTSIHKDVFPAATKAVTDMATAMNNGATPSSEQLSNTAIQVGKALQDPINGVTALRKVGVSLSDQQKEQVKHFMAVNDQADAQKLILQELAKEFGGSASAAATTFAGKMEMLKNHFIDLGVGAIPKIEEKLNEFLNWLAKLASDKTFKDFIGDVENFAKAFAKFEIKGFQTEWKVFKDVIETVKAVFEAMMPSLKALWNSLASNIGPAFREIRDAVVRLYNSLQPALMDVLKILAVIIGVTLIGAIYLFINGLRIAIDVLAFVIHVITDLIGWISNLIGWFGTAFSWLAKLAIKIVSALEHPKSLLAQAGHDIIAGLIDGMTGQFGAALNHVKNLGKEIVSSFKSLLGIHSPSAVFAEIGKNMGAGLIQGLQGIQAQANIATTQLVTGVPASGGTSPVNNNTSNNYNGGNRSTVNIQQVVLSTPAAVSKFFESINQDSLNAGSGLSVVQGQY